MFSRPSSLAVVTFWIVTLSFPALSWSGGGGWNGGADGVGENDISAWYLTTKANSGTISYCVRVADPGISVQEFDKLFRSSFARWTTYLTTKNVEQSLGDLAFRRLSKERTPSRCRGDEMLRVELGTSDPFIEAEKKKYRRPLALSAPGVIWVSPISNFGNDFLRKVEGALVHEIGHLFGNGHVPGTVMDQDFVLTKTLSKLWSGTSEIDQERSLVLREGEVIDVVFFPGKETWSELPETELRTVNPRQFYRTVLQELLGIAGGLGEYFGARAGSVAVRRVQSGFVLDYTGSDRKTNSYQLGKPRKIDESESSVLTFKYLDPRLDRIEGIQQRARTMVFEHQSSSGDKVPVYLHLNRKSKFVLEFQDPVRMDSKWSLLHSTNP